MNRLKQNLTTFFRSIPGVFMIDSPISGTAASHSTPSEQRRSPISKLQSQADRLMTAARHDSVKTVIRRACDALEEAREHLCEPNVDFRPSLLALVDMCLHYAESHLKKVDIALATDGPDAMLLR